MRIDKLLWFLRLAASRSFARQWLEEGHIRVNGRRIDKPSTTIRCGDVLTLPLRSRVAIVEIVALPQRRGPSAEAQACYRMLDGAAEIPIAASDNNSP
ncbi:MAG: RNA-binding S4 domain-containing protein [Sphingomonadales bacterium]|nr:RNA-binding S4 domain-containing protein [Sphingomonadales bacterium]